MVKETSDQQVLKVLGYQKDLLYQNTLTLDTVEKSVEQSISKSEALIKNLGAELPILRIIERKPIRSDSTMPLESWESIVRRAEEANSNDSTIFDILSDSEIKTVQSKITSLREEFDQIHRLDSLDWAIAGIAGIIAALVDIFLIQMPKHPGFLGGKGHEGGPLSNWIRDSVKTHFSPEEVSQLGKENWVPYDPSTSANLRLGVAGLGPRSHRFQSLGHDPVLGFILGVKDILNENFTAIDTNGSIITQAVNSHDPSLIGMNVFQAIGRVWGHLKSDVSTPAGLPPPIFTLLQSINKGNIGKHSYTIGNVARQMYRSGYDFSHFLSMSISPLIIEVLVRLGYFAKRRYEGNKSWDAMPFEMPEGRKRKPKLVTMLFSAHLIAAAANAGKIHFTGNPLALNYPQWLALFRYSFSQFNWVLFEKERQRQKHVRKALDSDWSEIMANLDNTWRLVVH